MRTDRKHSQFLHTHTLNYISRRPRIQMIPKPVKLTPCTSMWYNTKWYHFRMLKSGRLSNLVYHIHMQSNKKNSKLTCAKWGERIRERIGWNRSTATIHVQRMLRMWTAWWNEKIITRTCQECKCPDVQKYTYKHRKKAFTHHMIKYRIYATTRTGGNWCFTVTSGPSCITYLPVCINPFLSLVYISFSTSNTKVVNSSSLILQPCTHAPEIGNINSTPDSGASFSCRLHLALKLIMADDRYAALFIRLW